MPRHITNHSEVLEAIRRTNSIAELVEYHDNHFKHELELEVIVYGRNYAGKKVGPYVRLLTFDAGEELIRQGDIGSNTFYMLVGGTLDVYVRDGGARAGTKADDIGMKIAELQPDTSFGEMAILAGVPRNATVRVPAGAEAQVLEFSRPALRLLRKLERFGARLDRTYRDHGLGRTLEDLRQATGDALDRDWLAELKKIARFSVYGKNHVIAREGRQQESVLLIKNGWVRRVRGKKLDPRLSDLVMGADDETGVDFLGAGNCLGLEAVEHPERAHSWSYTAILLARTEIIEIPLAELNANPRLRERLFKAFDRFSTADDDTHVTAARENRRALHAAEREITTGVVDGTNLLVMDMDLCVRCGNCSLACHKVHGQSRLLRRGIHIERPINIEPGSKSNRTQHVLSPAVCMHCQDPECLTGCPTGAIGWKESGEIDITAATCIGCGDCATQCPYNAISMVPRGGGAAAKKPEGGKPAGGKPGEKPGDAKRLDAKLDAKSPNGAKSNGAKSNGELTNGAAKSAVPEFLLDAGAKLQAWFPFSPAPKPDAVVETENLLAVKCNLCNDTGLNPKGTRRKAYSCEENCPTGALVRVNPRQYFDEVGRTLGVVFQDSTHAVGRNIHKRDNLARLWHISGTLLTLALTLLTLLGLMRYGFDTPIVSNSTLSSWLTMRWLTGLVGLVGVAGVMTYPLRKQVYRRRAGALRYWLLAHLYAGVIAGILLLLHGGTRTGGLLTTSLMIAFDLVILSGLLGLVVYVVAPRIMTSIEGEPLLIEDLEARREELRVTFARLINESGEPVRRIIKTKLRRRFFTLRYLLRHYLRREPLTIMLARGREEFAAEIESLSETTAASSTSSSATAGAELPGASPRGKLIEAIEAAVTLRRVESLIYLHLLLKVWVAPHVVSTALMLALMVVHIIQVVFFHVR